MFTDYGSIKREIEDLEYEIKKINPQNLVNKSARKKYQEQYSEKKIKELHKGMIEELLQLSQGTKTQSKYLWVQHDKENSEPPRLVYGKVKEILPEYQDVPMLYLDGSGEQVVIETLLDRDFEFEHLRVQQQSNAKVYQFTNDASFSKSSFSRDSEGRKIDQICDWIGTLETNKLGLIRYNRINTETDFFQKLDEKVSDINGGENRIGWFGNVRGINRFEDCDTLLVLGQHRLPDYEIFNLTQLIFRQDVVDDEMEIQTELYNEYIQQIKLEKVYRMKSGNHKRVDQYDYRTNHCLLTSRHFDKSETYQSLHRLRLIYGTEHKKAFILSDTVLDVSIDELLDRYKEFGDKNILVINHLKENKFLIDRNEVYSEMFGWSNSQSKEFRRSDNKGCGDWLKSHRSLKYWTYKTKNRKSGKLYSWYDQSESDVLNWLKNKQGLEIKTVEMVM